MFERFTDRAKRVLVLAEEEARRLDHGFVGTEHLLLGILREGEGIAARVLAGFEVALEPTRQAVEDVIGRGSDVDPERPASFTPRAKKVLELSLREALELRHNYIGTEHLLLALLREGDGVGGQLLARSGVDEASTRHKALELLRDAIPPKG